MNVQADKIPARQGMGASAVRSCHQQATLTAAQIFDSLEEQFLTVQHFPNTCIASTAKQPANNIRVVAVINDDVFL